MSRSFLLRLFLLVVLALLAFIGTDFYFTYQSAQEQAAIERERVLQIGENRSRTADALISAGVNPTAASSGFWYITTDAYGDQSVAYFDADQWALQPSLSDAQIADLAHTVASSSVYDRSSMQRVASTDLPPQLQFHNELYSVSAQPGEFQATQATLEAAYAKGDATSDQLWALSYMYELQGNYAKRDELNAQNCKLYKVRCAGSVAITITGYVTDLSGAPIQNASVTVLSHPEAKAVSTDAKGLYSIRLSANQMEKIRINAVKRNFSAGVASLVVISSGKHTYEASQILLAAPITIVTVDTKAHTVTDPKDVANPDGSFVLHATSSTYEIPKDAIVDASGKPYLGLVDVYIYEFTRDTVPSSLVTLDTFDQVTGYAGDLMKSYGMPYIQFFAQDGTELDVRRSHPMLLTYRMSGLADLKKPGDNPYGVLTDADLQTLVAASQGDPGFPVDSHFLWDHKLLTFPPFWALDRKSGVWDNIGMRVLDMSGTIQAPFYTINNQRT